MLSLYQLNFTLWKTTTEDHLIKMIRTSALVQANKMLRVLTSKTSTGLTSRSSRLTAGREIQQATAIMNAGAPAKAAVPIPTRRNSNQKTTAREIQAPAVTTIMTAG